MKIKPIYCSIRKTEEMGKDWYEEKEGRDMRYD
jgi:hypothetical protein